MSVPGEHRSEGGELTRSGSDRTVIALDAIAHHPRDGDPQARRYAVDYARQMYARGIEHYERAIREIRFCGAERVLDVGSGAGQWSVALAAENQQVDGIEPRPEFVSLTRTIARALGLDGRVRASRGQIEQTQLDDGTVELAFCHSVLMFTDHELALTRIARALRDGGRMYCGYTTSALRLRRACREAVAGRWTTVRSMLATTVSAALYDAGIHRAVDGTVRAFERPALERLSSLIGLTPIARPHIQDEADEWLGWPTTFDFVARRDSDDGAARVITPAELVAAGAPRRALSALRATTGGEEADRVRLLALIKLGRLDDAEPLLRSIDQADRTLRGRFWLQRRAFTRALDELLGIEAPDPDDEFLIACARHGAQEFREAEALFAARLDAAPGDRRALAGAALAALDAGREDATRRYLAGAIAAWLEGGRSADTAGASEPAALLRALSDGP